MARMTFATDDIEQFSYNGEELTVVTTEELEEENWGNLDDTYAGLFNKGENLDDNYICVVDNTPDWLRSKVPNVMPELSPPYDIMGPFIEERKERGTTGEIAHNLLWNEMNFTEEYTDFLENNQDAREAIMSIADRVRQGEDIYLVGVWGPTKQSPRKVIRQEVEEELENNKYTEAPATGHKRLEPADDEVDTKLDEFVEERYDELKHLPSPNVDSWMYRDTELSQGTFQSLTANGWITKVEEGKIAQWHTTEELWNTITSPVEVLSI